MSIYWETVETVKFGGPLTSLNLSGDDWKRNREGKRKIMRQNEINR